MKKLVLLLIVIGIGFGIGISFHVNINMILESNKKHYEYFKKEKLVGVDGEVSLVGVIGEKEELYNEIMKLFEHDSFDYEYYLDIIKDKENSNDGIQNDINELSNKISDLEERHDVLNSEYDVLVKKYNKLKQSSIKNNSVSVNKNNSYNFPLINQYPNYPTGCESVALTMLLRYYGVSVTPDMVIAKLRKGSVPYWENGKKYGGNPEVEFLGNPYSYASYGVYEKPMADVANSFKGGVNAKSNFSFSEVIGLVQSGKPVMVWTSMGLSVPYISDSWIYKSTGETINWKANEHAVVMVDATDSTVVIADPIGGKLKSYSRSLFEQRYNYYGKKALYYL